MHATLFVALALASQDAPVAPTDGAPPSDAPPVDVAPAPVVPAVGAPRGAPVQMLADDVDGRYAKTHAVLAAFADDARGARVTTAVASGLLGAGLIGAGITYVAVSNLDSQLSARDHEDTQLGGFVIGGTAVIPGAIMVVQLASSSPEEERLAAFEGTSSAPLTRDDKRARLDAAHASLAQQASAKSWAPALGGTAFIAGGLVSAAAGGVFLALPHIPDVERGPMTHATGAELIGAGVSSVGLGTALIVAGSSSDAALQLAVLNADAAVNVAAAE